MKIKIMGPGCANCEKTANMVQEVVAETGVKAEVVKVTDFQEIAMAGVLSTPAIVIDDEIKCTGRIPELEEIKMWLK